MRVQLIRAMKTFCPDFQPIRHLLTAIGAAFIEQKDQIDYFFCLPIRADAPTSRRLKLRVENQQPRWIYYYDRDQASQPVVAFHLFEIHEPVVKDILTVALGVQTIVQRSYPRRPGLPRGILSAPLSAQSWRRHPWLQ
jgi:hypothetical protein